ncbi:MAG: hypothetical protein ACK6BG_09565 [Cyanobacteriota bacterium]
MSDQKQSLIYYPSELRLGAENEHEKKEYIRQVFIRNNLSYDDKLLDTWSSRSALLPPLQLPSPNEILKPFDHEVRRKILYKMKVLDAQMRTFYGSDDPPIIKSWVTLIAGPNIASVAWVRKSKSYTAQFILDNINVDIESGEVMISKHLLEKPKQISPYRRLSKDSLDDDKKQEQERAIKNMCTVIMTLAGSVSWALPPPWGWIATGGITGFQILFSLGEDSSNSKNELGKLIANISDLLKQQEIRDISTRFNAFGNALIAKLGSENLIFNSLKEIPTAYLDEVESFLTSHLFDRECDLDSVLAILKESPVDQADPLLILFVQGMQLWIACRNIRLKIVAIKASIAEEHRNLYDFQTYTSLWLSEYREIRSWIFGVKNTSLQGFIPSLEAQIKRLRDERLAKIEKPHRFREKVSGFAGGYPTVVYNEGTKFLDAAGPNDLLGGEFKFYDSLEKDGCLGSKTIPADTDANKAYDAHLTLVTKHVDEILNKYTEITAKWKDMIDKFETMLPPPTPTKSPTVEILNSVSELAIPDKSKGKRYVQYAYSIERSSNGPSEISPWSDKLAKQEQFSYSIKIPESQFMLKDVKAHLFRRLLNKDEDVVKDSYEFIQDLSEGNQSFVDSFNVRKPQGR